MYDAFACIINEPLWQQIRSAAVLGFTAVVLAAAFIVGISKDSHVDVSQTESHLRNIGPSRARELASAPKPAIPDRPVWTRVIILVSSVAQREVTLNGDSETMRNHSGLEAMVKFEVLVAGTPEEEQKASLLILEMSAYAELGGDPITVVDERTGPVSVE